MKGIHHNWRTDDFDFILPPERIAQEAIEPRDQSRLLHVTSNLSDHTVGDLPQLLRPHDLLVMNDTKVIPARLFGKRDAISIEILLHKKQAPQTWLAFARPGKRLKNGDTLIFAADFSAEILEKRESGEVLIRFSVIDEKLFALLHRYGEPPLPPYIKREKGAAKQDTERYQTIYAAKEGAVAAPTAGLHFTPRLFEALKAKNIETLTVTLHVGAGTFLPVKVEHLKDHVMHAEWGEITPDIAARINKAKQEGRRIVAVGTTSLRLLESAADEEGQVQPFSQDTAIFIYPGYRFKVVDVLLTNFHLPKSTLFMLVSAFAGVEKMRRAYEYAIAENYRFYSYGDATLLERA
ncbi:MAG: tRNA preQ1(34) S-adenosylmethionine ribosyltransferase-isomerase QueA [Alphaproteobacteria bacterium]